MAAISVPCNHQWETAHAITNYGTGQKWYLVCRKCGAEKEKSDAE